MTKKKKETGKTTASLKKTGTEKLTKLGKTTSEAHISFALRHGKITKEEAAAIDPKNFKILLDDSKSKTVAIIDLNKGTVKKPKSTPRGAGPRGGVGSGPFGPRVR